MQLKQNTIFNHKNLKLVHMKNLISLIFSISLIFNSVSNAAFGQNVTGSGTINNIPRWTVTGSTIGNSIIYENSGKIGLGTQTPNSLLNVFDTKNAVYSPTAMPTISLRLDNSCPTTSPSGQYAALGFVVQSISGGNSTAGSITLIQPDNTTKGGNFAFTLRNSFGSYNEIMRIQSDKTVGIGTTNPLHKLHVYGNISIEGTNSSLIFGQNYPTSSANWGSVGNRI